MKLVTLLQFAGLSHLALLAAGMAMPKVVAMGTELQKLPVFLRQLFWTYYLSIGATIIGFGTLTFVYANEFAAGHPLARAMALFLALFWLLRLGIGLAVFKMEQYLTNPLFKIGYFALNALFTFLVIVYAIAAFTPNL